MASTRSAVRAAVRTAIGGPGGGGSSPTHVLTPANVGGFFTGYYNDGSSGAISPETFEGENIYNAYGVKSGGGLNTMALAFGLSANTQIGSTTTIRWTLVDAGLSVDCVWNGTIYISGVDSTFREALTAAEGVATDIILEAL